MIPDPNHAPDSERQAWAARYIRRSDQLDRIFGRGGWYVRRDQSWDSPAVLKGIATGDVTIRVTRLPLAVCKRAAKDRVSRHGNESEAHARLKLAARLWMRSEGVADTRHEVSNGVGIVDAYSDKANWIIECGDTPFEKVGRAIVVAWKPRFTLIPYQWLTWEDGSPRRLFAFDFAGTAAVADEVSAAQRQDALAGAQAIARGFAQARREHLASLPSTLTGGTV